MYRNRGSITGQGDFRLGFQTRSNMNFIYIACVAVPTYGAALT